MSAPTIALRLPTARKRSVRGLPFVAAGAALALALLGSYVASNVYSSLAQRDLGRRMDALLERAAGLEPLERSALPYAAGDPVARLAVPSIGLEVVVVEGATTGSMRRGPGHLPGSAIPGQEGVAIVAGNRLGFGSFFRRLDALAIGDEIVTESAVGRTVYRITEITVVPADRLELGTDSSRQVLVLFGGARLWGGSDRLVVRAVSDGGM